MWPQANVNTVDGILGFFSVPLQLWQSFCHAVRGPRDALRVIATMPPEMVNEATMTCRMESGRGLVGLVYRAARRQVHLATGGRGHSERPNPWASTTSLPSSSARDGANLAPSGGGPLERKMKFSQVADQGDESEFPIMPEAQKAK